MLVRKVQEVPVLATLARPLNKKRHQSLTKRQVWNLTKVLFGGSAWHLFATLVLPFNLSTLTVCSLLFFDIISYQNHSIHCFALQYLVLSLS